jgi:hypothetical protein
LLSAFLIGNSLTQRGKGEGKGAEKEYWEGRLEGDSERSAPPDILCAFPDSFAPLRQAVQTVAASKRRRQVTATGH